MGQKTILYIEREQPLNCKVAERLTYNGYRVLMIDDPVQALRMARLLPPSLVIMNMDLLGSHSSDLIDQLRRSPGLSRVPIVALTSEVLYGRAADYIAIGCDCCLFAPFSLQQITSVVHKFLAKSQTRALGTTYRGSPYSPRVEVMAEVETPLV
jgi:DNA-binding response OmpR family regulator